YFHAWLWDFPVIDCLENRAGGRRKGRVKIFIVPCERSSWGLLQKYIFARGGKGKGKRERVLSSFPFYRILQEVYL
ncbi:hypothetical protein, partial [Nostoc sp. 106C]|uniref:hypothetical protein n=1 Tax=Nostoc sp. 106C TaxID=1932667 RepID=UPI000B6C338D